MIAVDASVVIPWLNGVTCPETTALEAALSRHLAVLPPVVLTEILSDPSAGAEVAAAIEGFSLLMLEQGYWRRAGALRAAALAAGRKARLADALVAQSCIDAKAALLTRDRDFAVFAKFGGLILYAE
jgi:hypothetical protein